ncbi:MAG: alpha/beta hydrolase-fold protein [Tepidisphaeraceae bacterium]
MIKRVLASVVLCFSAVAGAQTTRPVEVPRAEQFDLNNAAGKPYRISIATPAGKPPEGGFGVIYVLDANGFYATAVEATRFQQGVVPCVVVGVGYPQEKLDMARRYWDFTPWTSAEHIAIRKLNRGSEGWVEPDGTGGEEEFFAFLDQTLRPIVEGRFKIDPTRRAIFGHSLSARFVLHTLAKHPTAFDYYLAASPSIWWDGESVRTELTNYLADASAKRPGGVMITCGEYEQKPSATATPDRAAFFAKAKMVDNARDVAAQLKAAGLNVDFNEYAGENHGSVVPMAIARGVRFAFTTSAPVKK